MESEAPVATVPARGFICERFQCSRGKAGLGPGREGYREHDPQEERERRNHDRRRQAARSRSPRPWRVEAPRQNRSKCPPQALPEVDSLQSACDVRPARSEAQPCALHTA